VPLDLVISLSLPRILVVAAASSLLSFRVPVPVLLLEAVVVVQLAEGYHPQNE
jgi:hypothetical protein